MTFFSNNQIKYRDVKNSNADILFSANKYLKKSEKILENKIKLSGNSYFNKSINSPNLDDFSNQLVRLASNNIKKNWYLENTIKQIKIISKQIQMLNQIQYNKTTVR